MSLNPEAPKFDTKQGVCGLVFVGHGALVSLLGMSGVSHALGLGLGGIP